MSTLRTKVTPPKCSRACDACPWRQSNQGKRTSGGWYTKANLRRLWNGLKTGDAPGMTCHPTDPDNPPSDEGKQAKPGAETHECYGALLLIAREVRLATELCETHQGDAFKEYRKLRPKGLNKWGMAHWIMRWAAPTPFTGGVLPTEITEDDDIQHPDFDKP